MAWDQNKKQLSSLEPTIKKINLLFQEYDTFTDEEIKNKTQEFKNRLNPKDKSQKIETLEDILPEAFATVKQACKRLLNTSFEVKWDNLVWNMVPYDVQLVGSLILHQWKIAEMKTWEWKTLVAVMAVYLNALLGKWVHLVTVNDYLASRDAQWMWYLYERLGLSIGCVVKWVAVSQRRSQYEKDITYVENSELWFDYLRDNLVKTMRERVLLWRPLNFAIVDEIDSILVDEARTPLIISEPREEPTEKYAYYASIVGSLSPCTTKREISKGLLHEIMNESKWKNKSKEEDGDYYIDEKTKTVSLSSAGIARLEKILKVENLYSDIWYEEIHHIENALRASAVYRNNKEYIIQNGEVMIVDEHTWRAMQGRRFSEWLHQAIEAKEGVQIKRESQTMATITYQNFFKQYKKLSGMTGTALTEAEEFSKIYELDVFEVPTNKPIIRVDQTDKVFFNQKAKWKSIKDYIKFYHKMGQPILIWASTIQTSEQISKLLDKEIITHSVLNAKFHEQEAHIVSNAGKYKSIVVATNMAWRWTDIKLEPELNKKLANNYAKRINSLLKNKNWASVVAFSSIEFELTMDGIKNVMQLTDEELRHAEKERLIKENYEMHVIFNNKKSQPTDAFAEIRFIYTWEKDEENTKAQSEVIKKDLYYGLFILGTEKHESRRIDNQLCGRAGRQWDPGISVFFVALDDDIMKKMWWEKIQQMASLLLSKDELEEMELTQKQFTSSIVRAQKQMEWRHFWIRKHLFDYDSVIDKQRQRIYRQRDLIMATELGGKSSDPVELKVKQDEFIKTTIENIKVDVELIIKNKIEKAQEINQEISDFIETEEKVRNMKISEELKNKSYSKLKAVLIELVIAKFEKTISDVESNRLYLIFKEIILHNIDTLWIDHIDEMQHLRDKVWLMWYAQMDPLIVYKQESYEKYQWFLYRLKLETTQTLVNVNYEMPQQIRQNRQQIDSSYLDLLHSLSKNGQQKEDNRKKIFEDEDWYEIFEATNINEEEQVIEWPIDTNKKKKIRPNDPCPCWSGKKYKKCCGIK